MITFLRIIQLLYPIALILVPVIFHKRRFRYPMAFYRSMACSPATRKLYMVALSVAVLLFNFTFTRTDGPGLWLLPGFLYGLLLLRYRFTSAMLGWLHDDRMLDGLAFALILFTMTEPRLYPLSVSLALTFVAADFYPSRRILRMAQNPEECPDFQWTEKEIFESYY